MAYYEEMHGGKLNKRCREIVCHLENGYCGTDREIASNMGFNHRSMVQPRISDMIKSGVIMEMGKRKDDVTNKTVRVVRLNYGKPQQLELL